MNADMAAEIAAHLLALAAAVVVSMGMAKATNKIEDRMRRGKHERNARVHKEK